MHSHRLSQVSQPCCIEPGLVSSCLHGRSCVTPKLCLKDSESLLQELSDDAPNFFQAPPWQFLVFSKNPKSIKNWSPCHESALKVAPVCLRRDEFNPTAFESHLKFPVWTHPYAHWPAIGELWLYVFSQMYNFFESNKIIENWDTSSRFAMFWWYLLAVPHRRRYRSILLGKEKEMNFNIDCLFLGSL